MKKIEFRLYTKYMIVGTVVVSLIIILIGLISIAARPKSVLKPERSTNEELLNFQYPEGHKNLWDNRWISTIEAIKSWDWKEIQKFWLDTEEIGVTLLEEENDTLIFELFENYK